MTFISNAERIWSQGLTAGAGETANAIVLILACVVCKLPVRLIRRILTIRLRQRKALSFSSVYRLPSA